MEAKNVLWYKADKKAKDEAQWALNQCLYELYYAADLCLIQLRESRTSLWCFLFYQKKCALYFKKMQFVVCFLKMFRPPKRWCVLF